ncbi:site-2 protease family protein [Clostridium pasteurianum]|uniref:Zn-dependent protease n=1 Tax=Clostridium pasteurianum BC1 TaxID=86416 RepID=R4K1Y3_CLOPA|nr:site-2 protease family protein [Clostridium pasteurianum]AGK96573.1 Zn-dependent protease [Clostridium pasteurianum BC1]
MFDSTRVLSIILSIPGILIAFTFHEYAHAFVADKLGDKTPKFQGRLTLNPIAHIDPIGFILILILGFGWAKPVQTNPSAYKHYYKDDLKVSIAGPLANLAVGFVFAFIAIILSKVLTGNSPIAVIIITIASITSQLNCMLFLLNLLPIPGFDGFHILRDLFPRAFYNVADSMYRYQLIIFMVLVIPIGGRSILSYIIGAPSNAIYGMFERLAFTVVGF